jgi:hypothetical protein
MMELLAGLPPIAGNISQADASDVVLPRLSPFAQVTRYRITVKSLSRLGIAAKLPVGL